MDETISHYSPKEFAKIIGVSTSTLRRWEKEGLVTSLRTPEGERSYTPEMVEQYKKQKEYQAYLKSQSSKLRITGYPTNTPRPLFHSIVVNWHKIGLVMLVLSLLFTLIAATNMLKNTPLEETSWLRPLQSVLAAFDSRVPKFYSFLSVGTPPRPVSADTDPASTPRPTVSPSTYSGVTLTSLRDLYTELVARFDAFSVQNPITNYQGTNSPTPTPVTDITSFPHRSHSSLTNLTNSDDHTQYLYGSGRAGGQTLVGGIHANDILTLQSSTATTGTVSGEKALKIIVGSGGETEALTILNNGNIGFQKTNPGFTLDVGGIVNATAIYANGTPMVSSQWTTSGTSIFYTTGNVGIGTSTPTSALDIGGTLKTTGLTFPTGAVAGYVLTTDANGIASWTDVSSSAGPWGLTGNNLFPDSTSNNLAIGATDAGSAKLYVNGNVGIGTTAPSYVLDIVGQTRISNLTSSSSDTVLTSNAGVLESRAIDTRTWGSTLLDGSSLTTNYLTKVSDVNTLMNSLVFDNGTNVGIGTTSPGAKLEVYPTTDSIAGDYANQRIRLRSTIGVSSRLYSQLAMYDGTNYGSDISMGYGGSFGASYGLVFSANNDTVGDPVEIMRLIGGTGNVGIGTTAPSSKLSVVGALDISYAFGTAIPSLLIGANDVLGGTGRSDNTTKDGTIAFPHYKTAEEPVQLFFGFSDSTSNTILFGGGSSQFNAATTQIFYTAANYNTPVGTERMRITSAGNVGIGTTSPGYSLDVSGTGRLTGQLIANDSRTNTVGLIVRASAWTNTQNIQQWYDHNNGLTAYMTSAGQLNVTAGSGQGVAVGDLLIQGQDSRGVYMRNSHPLALASSGANPVDINAGSGDGFGGLRVGLGNGSIALTVAAISGNVGIGTTSPTSMLSVGASSQFQVNSTGNIVKLNNITTSFPSSQGAANSILRNDGAGTLTWADPTGTGIMGFWQRNGTSVAPTTITDSLGIGTTAPVGKFDITDTSNTLASLSLTNNTATTIGVGLNTAGVLDLQSTSLSTGNFLNMEVNGLTSGKGLNLTSNSTVLSTGNLASIDWSPSGSTEIFATGDLFKINTGTYANIGNLFALYDDGSELFSVDQSKITSALPHEFTAAGDVSMAYDLQFTNASSSNIKSDGPLTIASGEVFGSNNLTLRTYNQGAVLIDYANSDTTANTHTALQLSPAISGAISTGTRNIYGLYNNPMSTAVNTGGTSNLYGSYIIPSSTLATAGISNVYGSYLSSTATHAADAGTVNQYGLYIANGTSSTNGASTKYGLYVETPTGADTNYAAIFAGGNVGIGTTNPTGKLTVSDGNLVVKVGDIALDSGRSLYFNTTADPYWVLGRDIASATGEMVTSNVVQLKTWGAASNGFQYLDHNNLALFEIGGTGNVHMTGNVGIGTTSPGAPLNVKNDNGILFESSTDTVTAGDYVTTFRNNRWGGNDGPTNILNFDFNLAGAPTTYAQIKSTLTTNTGGGKGGKLYFNTLANNTFATRLMINNNGNVGIGTTSPATLLDVAGTSWLRGVAGGTSGLFVNSSGNVGVGTTSPVSLTEILGSGDGLLTVTDSTAIATGVGGSIDLRGKYTSAGDYTDFARIKSGKESAGSSQGHAFLSFYTSNYNTGQLVENVRITSTGNVGIGTTSPGASLNVVANAIGTVPGLIQGYSSGQTADLLQIAKNPGATPSFVFTSAGNLGIGTTSPAAKLEVVGNVRVKTGNGLQLYEVNDANYWTLKNAANDLTFTLNSTEYMRIINGGNVGIGTTAPTYTLDVKSTGTDIARFSGTNSTGCTLSDGGVIACSSDRNLKKNILDTQLGLDAVMNLRPVEFNWSSQTDGDQKSLGFIAQEVEEIAPSLVMTDSNGYKQLNSIGLIPLVAKAIQEQQEILRQAQDDIGEVTEQKLTLSELTTKVTAWDAILTPLQAIVQDIQNMFLSLQTQLGLVQADVSSTKDQVASLSASFNSMNVDYTSWKEAMASGSGVLGASDSALLDKVATVSSLLVKDDLEIGSKTTTFDLTVLNKLTSGVIEIGAGIDGDEINSAGGIRFQTLSQGPIDFMNGKVVIDVDGSITAKHLKLDTTDFTSSTAGTSLLKAGKTTIQVDTTSITSDSLVFITPITLTDIPIAVTQKTMGIGFTVTIPQTISKDLAFQWLVIN